MTTKALSNLIVMFFWVGMTTYNNTELEQFILRTITKLLNKK